MNRIHRRLSFALLLALLTGSTLLAFQHAWADRQLIAAVNSHDAPRVGALLRQGADPNTRDWQTYFYQAGAPFRPPWYEKSLASLTHRKPRPADPYVGPTVLMIAADHGDMAVTRSLLRHGADVTRTGTEIEYDAALPARPIVGPLWEAVKENKAAMVKLLLQHGAPVNERGRGLTPLLLTDEPEIATALLDGGADVNAATEASTEDNEGKTPLMLALGTSYPLHGYDYDDSGAQRLAMIRLLLRRGANINATARYGATALSEAEAHQQHDYVRLLLAHGADPNVRDQEGDTELTGAANEGDLIYLRLLLTHGADVNAQNNQGQTALMLASHLAYSGYGAHWQQDRRAKIRLLWQFGADLRLKDKHGKTAADYFNADPPVASGGG